MKKVLLMAVVCALCALLAACASPGGADAKTEVVPPSYGASIEAAKEEFAAVFAEFTNLKITDSATMAWAGDPKHIVIELHYTADQGEGVYGFEYALDEEGSPELLD
jgi:hypothetical protein